MIPRRRVSAVLTCLSALGLLVLVGCGPPAVHGSGVSKTETREIEACNEVKFVGGGQMNITVGPEPTFQITGDDNLLPRILDCVEAYATVGEIARAMEGVFGVYRDA